MKMHAPGCRCSHPLLRLRILVPALLVALAHAQPAPPVLTEGDFRTGLIVPTAEDRLWLAENAPPVRSIELNAAAIERIQAFRRSKDLPTLPLGRGVERGSELKLEVPLKTQRDKLRNLRVGVAGDIPLSLAAMLPPKVDNSELPGFPAIEKQFAGSCAAMAATYYTGTHMLAIARNWSKAETAGQRLSPKWSYNLTNSGVDKGCTLPGVFRVMQLLGAPTWRTWPADGDFTSWPSDAAVWREAIPHRFHEFATIYNLDTPAGLELLKGALATQHVLPFATHVYHWEWIEIERDAATADADNSLVGRYACRRVLPFLAGQTDDNHAMTIVGYNDLVWVDINQNGKVDDGERGALKVANSWGSSGQFSDGFGWIAYDALRSMSAVAGADKAACKN